MMTSCLHGSLYDWRRLEEMSVVFWMLCEEMINIIKRSEMLA